MFQLALECAGIIGACAVMNQQTLRLFLVSTDHQLSKTDISLKVKVALVGKLPFDLLPDCITVVKELPMTTHGRSYRCSHTEKRAYVHISELPKILFWDIYSI